MAEGNASHIVTRSKARTRAKAALGSFDAWRERNRDLGLSAILVMQVLVMFVVGPMAGTKLLDPGYVEGLRIATATTAVLIVNRYHPMGAAVALVFVVSMLSTSYVRTGAASHTVSLINTGIIVVFDIAVVLIVGQATFGAGKINVHRIMGAVIVYLYVGLIFAGLYRIVAGFDPLGFSHWPSEKKGTYSEFIYFSLGSLTSTGGAQNIVPMHPITRSLALLESVIGQLFPAIFVGRLVTLHGTVLEQRPRQVRKD